MITHAHRFIRFCLVGGTVTGIYYALLKSLVALGLHYVVANSIGWLICICLNFVLNWRFTFAREKVHTVEMMGYVMTYALQYLLGTGALVLFVELFDIPLTAAFLLTLVTTTLFSYASLARIVFRPDIT